MPIYVYKGLDKSGKEIKSNITTENLQMAKAKIKNLGIMLLDISEKKSTDSVNKNAGLNITFGKAVSVTDLALMTRQLATLVKAKIQIVEALSALVDQVANDSLKIVLSEVKQKVNQGSSLAKSMADYPKIFDNIYVNMVEAGEASGTLDIILLRLADFTEAQVKLKNKIKGAVTYPVVMLSFSLIMINIIFIFVIPKITKIFVSMKKELPLQTKICIWISDFLKNYWWLLLFGSIFGFFFFRKYIQTKSGERKWHTVLLKLPILGEIVMMINVSRFCSTLATLLNSGVPILLSMRIVKNLISNVLMQDAIDKAKDAVSEGASMTGPLAASGFFPPLVTHMIKLGEKSGEVENMLGIVAQNYQEQVETKLGGLTSVLEPIMMVGMGLMVGFIVFSVIVPIMSLQSLK
ncbi:MAG: type II secretion system inner membrane protein GspF [Bacteriovoracaceae bacterium]